MFIIPWIRDLRRLKSKRTAVHQKITINTDNVIQACITCSRNMYACPQSILQFFSNSTYFVDHYNIHSILAMIQNMMNLGQTSMNLMVLISIDKPVQDRMWIFFKCSFYRMFLLQDVPHIWRPHCKNPLYISISHVY